MMIEYNLKIMDEYLEKFKEYLDSIKEETYESYLKHKESSGPFGNVTLDIQFISIFDKNLLRFPQLHYSSFLVTWYSFLESELKGLCEFCNEEYKLGKSTKDLSGKYSIKNYIEKNIGNLIDKEKWMEIDNLAVLRNKVAHLGLDFDKRLDEYKSIKTYIDTHKLIKEGKYSAIYITFEFCKYLLDFANKLFFGIYYQINSLYMIEKGQ